MNDEQDVTPEPTQQRQETARTVEYEKFSRVVAAKRGLEQQVAELREANQALEERASVVDALAQQLEQMQKKATDAEQKFTRYQAISSAVGSADADVVEAFEWQYGRLQGEDKPELSAWVASLKEAPDTAPAVLRPWLKPAEPAKPEPTTRRASPSAGHEQPHGAKSAYSHAEMQAAKAELLEGRPEKWLAMRKAMGIE